jgi:hypothetical protein
VKPETRCGEDSKVRSFRIALLLLSRPNAKFLSVLITLYFVLPSLVFLQNSGRIVAATTKGGN